MCSVLSYAGQNIKWNTAEDAYGAVADIEAAADLRCLILEANTLGVEAAKVLGNALAKHPEFERAHWKDLFTGRLKTEIPEALKNLFSGIMRANAKLIELDLSDNALGPVGVEGMVDFIKSPSCYSLQELRLNNNGLGIKGGTMLAQSLIELAENASKAGTPLKLKVFVAGRNRLEIEGAKIFSKFFSIVKSLEEVAMPQNGIFHEGIAALAKAFAVNPHLRIVNLNDNTFTPKGAKAMAEQMPFMPNLEVINFGDCLLKTAGAISIAGAIKEHQHKLQELNLDSNEIRMKGGHAIIDAVKDKKDIKSLWIDANQFGEEGLQTIVARLSCMGKINILISMEDNEEPESDDENSSENEEEGDSAENEQDEEESNNQKGVSPLKREISYEIVKCTAAEFVAAPTPSRILGLEECSPNALVAEAVQRANDSPREPDQGSPGSPEAIIHECIQILMKTASLYTVNNKRVIEVVDTSTKELAKTAFSYAKDNDLQSVITNSVLVHCGLIKSENKNFKISWDLKGGLIALANIIHEDYFPSETKSTLQFFFSRPGLTVDNYPQEKHKLLSSLFKAL